MHDFIITLADISGFIPDFLSSCVEFCRILSRNRVSVSASQAQFPVIIEISFQDGGQSMRDHHSKE